jgi:competence protein ComFC
MPVCSICGIPLPDQGHCLPCNRSKPKFVALRSWGVYDGAIRQAIHKLKYRKDVALGETLARFLIELLDQYQWQIDMVLPVPLSVARNASRGYNQSALLARPLSLACHIPYRPRALKRIRDTESQVKLDFDQRQMNVQGAFRADRDLVLGKSVLLIDDVATSGATIDACADALLHSGGQSIYALTLARAI